MIDSCEDKIVEILDKFQINGNQFEGGTDKVHLHSYDKLYGKYLNSYLDKSGTLLEIGVRFGGSSVLWSNLLPKFNLCLLDVSDLLTNNNRSNLDPSRTKYFIDDAYQENVRDNIRGMYPNKFDIIIDDGPHTVESQIRCVELYLSLLTDTGILIIEDIENTDNLQSIIDAIPAGYNYTVEDLRHIKGRYDDLAIVIKKKMNKKTKIVMTTMFRNEATVIQRMLESCYKYIDYYVIQDNGSTDGTDQIVRDFFADKNIPGVLYKCDEGWQGFGWNRDHLIQYTQNTNHGCDWILKMDCDEVLEVDDDFDWTPFEDTSIQSFHITAKMGSSIYYRAWIWNARLPWRFNHDPCHETIYCPIEGIGEDFQRYDLPNKIRQLGFPQGQSWSNPTKFISDALILEEKMIKENSILSDLYHFWYIGKSYHDARQGQFPLGESQQKEFARRCIYYFTEYLNTTHDFSNSKTGKGVHEMAYMALWFISNNQRFINENTDTIIENLKLCEQFSPPRNDHLVSLAELYNQLEQYDKMLEITTRLVDPNRKNPFPEFYLMIDSNLYVDTGDYVKTLHDIALSNTTQAPKTFMINSQLNKKLFVVDNFYTNPDEVRNFALGVEFKEDIKWYKGKRSTQHYHPPGIVEAFENIIGQKITKFDQSMPNGCFQITTANDPQVYHHDLQKWAAMIYLTPNAPVESGTRLMRSKINQATHMTDPNINDAFSGGFLDGTKFEVVADAGNLYNRLVIMDAQNIHSAGTYFGQNNDTGRLTHLFFFD